MDLVVSFFVISLICLVGAVIVGYRQHSRLKNSFRTNGKVIELVEDRDSEGAVIYFPRVSYVDVWGRKSIFTSHFSSRPQPYKIGQTIKIAYDQNNEIIFTLGRCYGFGIALISIAIGSFFIGMAFLFGPNILDALYFHP